MAGNREELKRKALEAESPEAIVALVEAAGDEITAGEAAQLFDWAKKKRDERRLSLDELATVAGDVIDWDEKGCAATVEEGSSCWGTDGGCTVANVQYKGFDPAKKCPKHPGPHEYERDPKVPYKFYCKYCGEKWQATYTNACVALA